MSNHKSRDGSSSRDAKSTASQPVAGKESVKSPKQRAGRTWRWRLAAVLVGVAATIVLLAVVEVALRVVGYGHPTAFLIRHANGRGWTVNDRFHKRFYPSWGAGNSRPFFVPDAKSSNTIRIFVLGESAALGTPSPAFGFVRMLGVMLRAKHPGRDFEIHNAAMRGINSHVILPIAKDCARRGGDVFIVYLGNNELIGLHGVSADSTFLDRNLALSRTMAALKGTRLGQLALSSKRRPDRNQDMDYFRGNRCAAGEARREAVYRNFTANLGEICDAVRDSTAGMVLLTVASNVRDFPPKGSLHNPGLPTAALAPWDAAYASGVKEESAGRFEEAIRHYQAAAQIDEQFADVHFRLGRCHLALNRHEQARRHFGEARDRDALPFRADSRINEIIRSMAAGRGTNEVRLIDLEQQLGQAAGVEGLPGDRFFRDHVHFQLAGDYEVALALLPGVAVALGDRLGKEQGATPSLDECAASLGYNDWEAWQLDSAIFQQTSKPPFRDQIDHPPRQLRLESELKNRAKAFGVPELQRARELALAAISRNPDDWQLRQNLGSMSLINADYPTAVSNLQQVVAAFPDWIPPRLQLGRSLLGARRYAEAAEQFKECLRVERNLEPARQALAEIEGSLR